MLILLGLGLRLFLASRFLLSPDEANYWQWSRHLALGYHDHPPLIAWSIRLAAFLFGEGEWVIRLPTLLGQALGSGYLALLAARWFSWRNALHLTVLSQSILLLNGSALIATPDGLLLPCWAAACFHAAVAIERNRRLDWLATGCWFGLGLLAKYTMLLFPFCLFLVLICSKNQRKLLTGPWPWLGLMLGLCFLSPVLVWNAQHDWVSFRHVLYQGGANESRFFTLKYLADFFASQAALLSPLVFWLMLRAWCDRRLQRTIGADKALFLFWMSAPGFCVFALLSLHVRIYGNWPAPVYLSGLALITAIFAPQHVGERSSTTWKLTVLGAAFFTVPVLVQVAAPVIPLPIWLDRSARECSGWDGLANTVWLHGRDMPRPQQTFFFGLRYQYASELAYYMPGQPFTLSINRWTRPNVYDFWTADVEVVGKDGVGLIEDGRSAAQLAALFERSDPPVALRRLRRSPWFGIETVETLYLFKGYGFKGGLRWQPPNSGDIRAAASKKL